MTKPEIEDKIAALRERLAVVPTLPGIYVYRDTEGRILYVGKARSLRNRIRSYFGSTSSLSHKTRELVERIADFEYKIAESEQEALLLENSLIKKHKPKYNARLKDDKTYPYIKIDLTESFPRVYVTRKVSNDSAKYFGPYASAGSVRKTLAILKRLFPYRSCTKNITGKDYRPCLEHYIHRCVAPCTGYASREQYRSVVLQVVKFLEGNTKEVISDISQEMHSASELLEFERAAVLRDRLRDIERMYEKQKVVMLGKEEMDVLGMARRGDEAWIEVFFVRMGSVIEADHFIVEGISDKDDSEIIEAFIGQFYLKTRRVPHTILVENTPENKTTLSDWLSEIRGRPVYIVTPKRGAKHGLIQMATQTASEGMTQFSIKRMSSQVFSSAALSALKEELNAERPLERIECYDISHIQGAHVVASMVVFIQGRPCSSDYRRFKIKIKKTNDDFASMREVVYRRFKRLQDAEKVENSKIASVTDKSFNQRPDLVLIDGGKGQLSVALESMLKLRMGDIPLAAIAKREEEIYLPDSPEPITLEPRSQALMLLQRIRDEAHRFAVTFHRSVRSKSSVRSLLDDVPGIGPKRKKILVRRFGSAKMVLQASEEELAAVPGITRDLAKRIKEIF